MDDHYPSPAITIDDWTGMARLWRMPEAERASWQTAFREIRRLPQTARSTPDNP